MSHEFFPLSIDEFNADIKYHDLKEGELQFGDIRVTTHYLNHTVLTLGYRLETSDGTSVAYITDHEPFDHRFATEGYKRTCFDDPGCALKTPDDRHADFLAGLDLLIHDAQYTASEYPTKEGWGHATVEYVVDIAMSVGVKQLALFHHDPMRTDAQIDEIVLMAQDRVKKEGGSLIVFAAADNTSIEVNAEPTPTLPNRRAPWNRLAKLMNRQKKDNAQEMPNETALTAFVEAKKEILVSYENDTVFNMLSSDGLHVSRPAVDQSLLEAAQASKPSVLLIHYAEDTLDTCKRVREDGGEWGKEVPVIVIAQNQEIVQSLREQGVHAGVTDWVVEPFSASYIRTRIRMAVSRNPCKWVPPTMPKNEKSRLEALRGLNILDSAPDDLFDRLTRTVAAVFDVPVALVSLVDENRQWFKSKSWLCPKKSLTETSREVSFCGHAILQNELFIIPDATQDSRFAHNPLVTDPDGLQIRFYAGCPISVSGKDCDTEHNIGTLCIIDTRPRDLDDKEKGLLNDFAAMVKRELEALKDSRELKEGVELTIPRRRLLVKQNSKIALVA